ncbi:predicted protein [Naegleria gruberi]|uniref:Phosphomannomutase n=1 Tax=Naegleria gruberi TaxID=5762 RepID=D2V5R1_NAEGR|nr:uncharacterized protein NAEGRDRAFT_31260 [Naegleria gruberi]EFC47841.1 predicted protein [Naegleria gruberi]|eukprot:XP_002680585.1 predicted protein [Naegleria gruberi strain NEG-M]
MSKRVLALFDVDGTLTVPRNKVTTEMYDTLMKLKQSGVAVGIVGGSDLAKQYEQMGENILNDFDYVFSENGLVAYGSGKLIKVTSIKDYLGEDRIKEFVNYTLRALADIDIPVKRGTFIEFRKGMFNVSPIGRNCSQEERDDYEKYDHQHQIRAKLVQQLQEKFKDYNLKYSIGGQISFDVFPEGWDKTFCLQYVQDSFDEIHFFGDKTSPGGNDYEIFSHERTVGHSVKTFNDTIKIIKETWLENQN